MENASSATPVDCIVIVCLCRYSWEDGHWVLLKTKTWEKLRNGWFKATLTDGTSVSHMGIRGWYESENDAREDLVRRICRCDTDPETHSKLIALGKLLESAE